MFRLVSWSLTILRQAMDFASRGALPLLLGVCAYVILWSCYPHALEMSDPWHYSRIAYTLLRDPQAALAIPAPNLPFVHRIAVTAPVAALYSFFGVSGWTTHMWSLFCALIVMATIWQVLPSRRSKLFGIAFGLTSVPLFQQSINLMPDLVCTAFLGLSALVLFQRRQWQDGRKASASVGFALLLFVASLAKETAAWAIPLWLVTIYRDSRRGDLGLLRRFHLPAAITGVCLTLGYLAVCNHVWGDPLARLHCVEETAKIHIWAWDGEISGRFVDRMTLVPPRLLWTDHGVVAILALLAVRLAPRTHRFWLGYAGTVIFLFWFGSANLRSYNPLPAVSRMVLPALPGILILAALSADAACTALEQRGRRSAFLGLAIVVIPAAVFISRVASFRWTDAPEATAMSMLKQEVMKSPMQSFLLLCSDERSPKGLEFYFEYQYPINLRVLHASSISDADLSDGQEVFLYVDEAMSRYLKRTYQKVHHDEAIRAIGAKELVAANGIYLYRAANLDDLRRAFSARYNERLEAGSDR